MEVKGFFNPDNPLMVFLSRLTDVILLNLLCVLCCIPVITVGASLTALHYVTLKMVKGEEGYILRSFFKSFRDNFKQATVIWLLLFVLILLFLVDVQVLRSAGTQLPRILSIVIYAVFLLVAMTAMYVFPVLSRFCNTTLQTIRNAFFMSILNFPKTLLMAVIYLLPLLFLLHYSTIPVYLLIGFSGGAYINSYLWKGIFRRYEPEEEETGSDQWTAPE